VSPFLTIARTASVKVSKEAACREISHIRSNTMLQIAVRHATGRQILFGPPRSGQPPARAAFRCSRSYTVNTLRRTALRVLQGANLENEMRLTKRIVHQS
jgi:hypothetical protein